MPKKLMQATQQYGAASALVTEELAVTGDVVTSVCHLRAEIEYVTLSLARGDHASFETFYSAEAHAIPNATNLASTWKQQCQAYRIGDATFTKYLEAVGAYGSALSGFAADDSDAGAPLGQIVKGLGESSAVFTVSDAPYKSALTGAAMPVTRVVQYAQAKWRGRNIGKLVVKTDPDIQLVLTSLTGYVTTVRSVELREVREALGDLTASLVAANQLFLAASTETALEGRLRETERRLDALLGLLTSLKEAHSKLAAGWKTGKSTQASTLREISALTRRVRQEVRAFENPVRGAGS